MKSARAILLALAVAGAACSSSVELPAGGGAGASGGGSGGNHGGEGGGGGNDGSCSGDDPCPEPALCIYYEGSCAPNATGSCMTVYTCDGPPSGPLCGCDGEVLEGTGRCTSMGYPGPYADPDTCAIGTFACGPLTCRRHVEFCQITLPGPTADPVHACIAVADEPGFCTHGIADCECLALDELGCVDASCCAADADHQETVTVALE
jgi:hypothetical protein